MDRIIEVPKHKLKGEDDYRQLTIRIENDTFMALEELTRKTELSRNKVVNILLREAMKLAVIKDEK